MSADGALGRGEDLFIEMLREFCESVKNAPLLRKAIHANTVRYRVPRTNGSIRSGMSWTQ